MVYCQRCGRQNADDAKFCNSCAAPLAPTYMERRKAREDECEQECPASGRRAPLFWGVIIVLIGLMIALEGMRNVPGMRETFAQVEFWWIIPLVIGIAIIVFGVAMVTRKR